MWSWLLLVLWEKLALSALLVRPGDCYESRRVSAPTELISTASGRLRPALSVARLHRQAPPRLAWVLSFQVSLALTGLGRGRMLRRCRGLQFSVLISVRILRRC